jgi:hypothetical protein
MTMVSLIAQYEVALWPCRSANATTDIISFSDYSYGNSGPAPVAPMSAAGQARRFRDFPGLSGPPQTSDIGGPGRHFAFVPILLQKFVEAYDER